MTNIITIDFHQDTIFAVERDDGVFVAVKPISDCLGLKWSSQFDRLNRDPILSEGILMTGIPSVGSVQETVCLRLDLVNGWLFTIDESRVKDDEVRDRVLMYKRECYAVLFRHFQPSASQVHIESKPSSLPTNSLTYPEKCRIVEMFRRMAGARAAAEKALQLGFESVPSLDAMLRQQEFHFVVDLNDQGPSEAVEVN